MAKYKFPIKDTRIHDGYTTLVISDFEAEVDEKDTNLMRLVEKYKGEKIIKVKRGKK